MGSLKNRSPVLRRKRRAAPVLPHKRETDLLGDVGKVLSALLRVTHTPRDQRRHEQSDGSEEQKWDDIFIHDYAGFQSRNVSPEPIANQPPFILGLFRRMTAIIYNTQLPC